MPDNVLSQNLYASDSTMNVNVDVNVLKRYYMSHNKEQISS